MKLGQFEGVDLKLLLSKFKEIWSKPGGADHPPSFFFNKNDQKSPKKLSNVYDSTPIKIQPHLFKFSVNVVLPKDDLFSTFHFSTTISYHTSRLSQDPPLTQLPKLLKYPTFRPKYLQWRSMLQKTEHTF